MVSAHDTETGGGDTMIYNIVNGANCLPVPASARCCQTEMWISGWFCELAASCACERQAMPDLRYSLSIINKPFLSFIFNGLVSC